MPDSHLTSGEVSYKINKNREDKLNAGALNASSAEMRGDSAPGPFQPDPGNAGVGSDLVTTIVSFRTATRLSRFALAVFL